MKFITLGAIALPATFLILSLTWPGLAPDWSGLTKWLSLIPTAVSASVATGLVIIAVYHLLMHRDWRFLPTALAPLTVFAIISLPFSTHAPLLTDPPIPLVMKDGRGEMALSALIDEFESPDALPFGMKLFPPTPSWEVALVRIHNILPDLKALMEQHGDFSVGNLVAPDRPDFEGMKQEIILNQEHLQKDYDTPILSCRPPWRDPTLSGPIVYDCEIERQIRYDQRDRLEERLSDLEKNLITKTAEYNAANEIHANQLLTLSEATSLLNYLDAGRAEAISASTSQVIALITALIILLSALVTPGITLVPLIVFCLVVIAYLVPTGPVTVSTWVHLGFFTIIFWICRFIHLAAITNWPVLRLTRSSDRAVALKITALRSIPIGVVLILLTVVSSLIDTRIQGWIYGIYLTDIEEDEVRVASCVPGETLMFRQIAIDGCADYHLRSDALASAHWHISAIENEIIADIDMARLQSSGNIAEFEKNSLLAFDRNVPKRLAQDQVNAGEKYISETFNNKRCRLASLSTWGNCIGNMLKKPPRSGYIGLYETTHAKFHESVTEAVEASDGNIDLAHSKATSAVIKEAAALRIQAKAAIKQVFQVKAVLGYFAQIILVASVLGAISHIFLRNLSSVEGLEKRLTRHGPSAGRIPGSNTSPREDDQFTITDDSNFRLPPGSTVRIRKVHTPVNIAQIAVLPRILFAPRGRFAKYVVPTKSERSLLSFSEARRVITVNIKDGQSVAFESSALLGYEDQITFRAMFLRRVFDILCGRYRTVFAIGPGKIFLLSSGDMTVLPAKDDEGDVYALANQIIAWSPDAQFTVKRDTDITSLYLNQPLVTPITGGLAIVDQARRSRGGGPRPIGLLAALFAQV